MDRGRPRCAVCRADRRTPRPRGWGGGARVIAVAVLAIGLWCTEALPAGHEPVLSVAMVCPARAGFRESLSASPTGRLFPHRRGTSAGGSAGTGGEGALFSCEGRAERPLAYCSCSSLFRSEFILPSATTRTALGKLRDA